MAAIFYHDEEQKRLALETKPEVQKGQIHTTVLPLTEFYLAEDYHQKYWLQHQLLFMQEIKKYYPQDEDFISSTLAARLNGYIGGHGNLSLLETEIDRYGLSAKAREKLHALVARR